jgi:hypothetical protein
MNTATQIDIAGTVSVSIPIHIRVSMLIDLVNQALEDGSISYWVAEARNVKRSELKIDGFEYKYCYSFEIREEGETDWHTVNTNTIANGITKILQGKTPLNDFITGMIFRSITGEDVIDSEALDCIVQIGLFGDTVYG